MTKSTDWSYNHDIFISFIYFIQIYIVLYFSNLCMEVVTKRELSMPTLMTSYYKKHHINKQMRKQVRENDRINKHFWDIFIIMALHKCNGIA